MKKMLFIVNPCAGKRRIKKYLIKILDIFNRADYEVVTFITARQGDCAQIARERAGQVDLMVCAGGDGTFNEMITGILDSGVQVSVGYIPCGSTNDFAKSLQLSTNILKAAKAIVDGSAYPFDVGRFGNRYFSYVASFGAFTRASYATPQSMKNALGHTAYVLEGIKELSQLKKIHIRFDTEDQQIEGDYIFGAVSNSTSVGGVLTLDPEQVDMSDGLFELLLIRKPENLRELRDCIRALRKRKYNCSVITFVTTANLKITADPEMVWTLDGEREDGHAEVLVENLHHAIRLVK
ncbi:MAG: YegS/Rv2252/BmrU family lipid kinase [Oscillospiraceae bacterium]|nr:YegS/Rv2252/BmrU family lipid kinase [Oscillospiraceae bacterium]